MITIEFILNSYLFIYEALYFTRFYSTDHEQIEKNQGNFLVLSGKYLIHSQRRGRCQGIGDVNDNRHVFFYSLMKSFHFNELWQPNQKHLYN